MADMTFTYFEYGRDDNAVWAVTMDGQGRVAERRPATSDEARDNRWDIRPFTDRTRPRS